MIRHRFCLLFDVSKEIGHAHFIASEMSETFRLI